MYQSPVGWNNYWLLTYISEWLPANQTSLECIACLLRRSWWDLEGWLDSISTFLSFIFGLGSGLSVNESHRDRGRILGGGDTGEKISSVLPCLRLLLKFSRFKYSGRNFTRRSSRASACRKKQMWSQVPVRGKTFCLKTPTEETVSLFKMLVIRDRYDNLLQRTTKHQGNGLWWILKRSPWNDEPFRPYSSALWDRVGQQRYDPA